MSPPALSRMEQALAKLSPAKRLIVRALIERGELTRRQIADVLGYQKTESARVHLDALLDAGVIVDRRAEVRPGSQPYGPPPMMYRLAESVAGKQHAR